MAELRPDDAELLVLSVLAEGQQYGYAITKQVGARSSGGISLSAGILYPLLARLEEQGLISSSWDEVRSDRAPEDGRGRRRKWYRLAAKGRKRLEQRIASHRAYRAVIDSFIGPEGDGQKEPAR